jgi:anti-anti-sigma factor
VRSADIDVATVQTADVLVIRVKGDTGLGSGGALLDALLTPAAQRPAVVMLDLSGLHSITRLAMGVLSAYRRGVVRTGGRVRLGGVLQPAVKEALAQADLLDLFDGH